MTDDMVEVVVRVPRQVGEAGQQCLLNDHNTAEGERDRAVAWQTSNPVDAIWYYARAALLETDLTPPPDVVVVDGVRLTATWAAYLRAQPHHDSSSLTGAVRDALLAQEAEPPQDDLAATVGASVAIYVRPDGTWTCDCGKEGRGGAFKLHAHRIHEHVAQEAEPPAPEPIKVGDWVCNRHGVVVAVLAPWQSRWVVGYPNGVVTTFAAADLSPVPAPEGEAT